MSIIIEAQRSGPCFSCDRGIRPGQKIRLKYCEKIARRIADVTPDIVSVGSDPQEQPSLFGDWEDGR